MIKKTIELLLKNNITISTAESCTGGLVSKTITDFPGVSEIFSEGYVTYSNSAKIKNLNVNPKTLKQFGAVSEEVAREMAIGVRNVSGTQIGVSATGIAGPGGDSPTKPIGLVYIACSTKDDCIVRKLNLNGTRDEIRKETTDNIFKLIYESIK